MNDSCSTPPTIKCRLENWLKNVFLWNVNVNSIVRRCKNWTRFVKPYTMRMKCLNRGFQRWTYRLSKSLSLRSWKTQSWCSRLKSGNRDTRLHKSLRRRSWMIWGTWWNANANLWSIGKSARWQYGSKTNARLYRMKSVRPDNSYKTETDKLTSTSSVCRRWKYRWWSCGTTKECCHKTKIG